LAKRRWAREYLDGLRRALIFEPRGHDIVGLVTVLLKTGTREAEGPALVMRLNTPAGG
jgi:proline racemase